MTMDEAKQAVGQVGAVQDTVNHGIFGKLEYVTADGWAGIRGPHSRLDEVKVERLEWDPT